MKPLQLAYALGLLVLALALAAPARAQQGKGSEDVALADIFAHDKTLVPEVMEQACRKYAICSESTVKTTDTTCVPVITEFCWEPDCWGRGAQEFYAVTCSWEQEVYNWFDFESCTWQQELLEVSEIACGPDPDWDLVCNSLTGAGPVASDRQVTLRRFVPCR